ncbi:MAG TPA: hypothetical protein VIK14_11965 [Ignavibacteria bacterium]
MKYTREEARIKATQYAYEIRHGRHTEPKEHVSFKEWFLNGVRKYESMGVEFDFLTAGLVRMTKNEKSVLRTVQNFKDEYESQFPAATKVKLEECAGIA